MEKYDEDVSAQRQRQELQPQVSHPLCEYNIKISELKDDIFVRTSNDNKVAPSVVDKQFLSLMKSYFQQDETGHWSAPLPFKQPKPPMPSNRLQAWKRAQILDSKLDHFNGAYQ
jgi:hypothetical protein